MAAGREKGGTPLQIHLKAELVGFHDRLDVGHKRKSQDDSKTFHLSIYLQGWSCR